MLTVLQVANRHGAIVVTLPRPARHSDLIITMSEQFAEARPSGHFHASPDDQGFLLSDGSYATRERAAEVALAAGQASTLPYWPQLFSEDLW